MSQLLHLFSALYFTFLDIFREKKELTDSLGIANLTQERPDCRIEAARRVTYTRIYLQA